MKFKRRSWKTAAIVAPFALLSIPLAATRSTQAAPSPHVQQMRASSPTRLLGDGVSIDSVALGSIPAQPSVAWSMGFTRRSGWVLSGDPLGLQLTKLTYAAPGNTAHGAALAQQYGTPQVKDFYISEWLVDDQAASVPMLNSMTKWTQPDHGVSGRQNVRDISWSVNGSPVKGQYYEAPQVRGYRGTGPQGKLFTARIVDVDQGNLHIRAATFTLSQSEFMSVLNSLTDGHQRPDLIAHLQAELDAAPPSEISASSK